MRSIVPLAAVLVSFQNAAFAGDCGCFQNYNANQSPNGTMTMQFTPTFAAPTSTFFYTPVNVGYTLTPVNISNQTGGFGSSDEEGGTPDCSGSTPAGLDIDGILTLIERIVDATDRLRGREDKPHQDEEDVADPTLSDIQRQLDRISGKLEELDARTQSMEAEIRALRPSTDM
jgi:hypothetical protein